MRYFDRLLYFGLAGFILATSSLAAETKPSKNSNPNVKPLFKSIDMNVGETRTATLSDGSTATVKLIGVKEHRDKVRNALRGADVTVEVNGQRETIGCGTYHLPVELGGVRIDCPVVEGYGRYSLKKTCGQSTATRGFGSGRRGGH